LRYLHIALKLLHFIFIFLPLLYPPSNTKSISLKKIISRKGGGKGSFSLSLSGPISSPSPAVDFFFFLEGLSPEKGVPLFLLNPCGRLFPL